nr:hypothetical protein [Tanacetum cinerariifolium]
MGTQRNGHFARDYFSKTSVPFQPKHLSSSKHKQELSPTKDFKAKYNKIKAKLALLSSSASASKASIVKNKGLIAEAYKWDKEEVSSDDNVMVEVKEDTISFQEYMDDLEEEYQAIALLEKSKRFFTMGTQRFSSAKAADQTECHKCGRNGHFARDYFSKTSVPFQPKHLSSSKHKQELSPTKDFKAKYNKIKAKLALLSSSASASKASIVKNKGLIAEAYKWDKEEVSSDDNVMVEVKVYGSDLEGFGENPLSNEFRLYNSDEWRFGNHSVRVTICSYGGGDMVVRHGLKGCLDHQIIRSSPILPPL